MRLVDCPGKDIRKHPPLSENGPDPVVDAEVFTAEYITKIMRKRHVPIKALLLDQTVVSGIGNWVGDEVGLSTSWCTRRLGRRGMRPGNYGVLLLTRRGPGPL